MTKKIKLYLIQLVLCSCILVQGDNPVLFVANRPEDSIGLINEGDTTTFYCTAAAGVTLPVQYSWISTDLKGNIRDLSRDSRYTVFSDGRLKISNAQHAKDDGYYHCVIRNVVGAALSRRATFRVAYLTIQSSSGVRQAYGNLGRHYKYTLSTTDSFPLDKTTYRWIKNDNNQQVFSETDRLSFSAAGNMYISNLGWGDIARYGSTVTNSKTGTHYTRPTLQLFVNQLSGSTAVSPSILLGPSHEIAFSGKGQTVIFECFVTGNPMPQRIIWKKDGTAISSSSTFQFETAPGGTLNKRLKVKNVLTLHEGKYSCETDPPSVGLVSWVGNLTVYTEPWLISRPQNATKRVDNSVTFSCGASGKPAPMITWYNNGRRVYPSGRETLTNGNKDYTILKIAAQDAGIIQCVASNEAGHQMADAYLTIQGVQIWITLPPQDRSVIFGETVEFQCQARGNPIPTVRWEKDMIPVDTTSPSTRFRQKSDGTLQITNTKREDSGIYNCIAFNSNGRKNASAVLKVLTQTRISTPLPARTIAIKGHTKILAVGVTKDAFVSIQFTWSKDGAAINEPRITVLQNGSLSITAVHDSDAGTYKCVVTSDVGNASTSTVLVVQEVPLSPSRPVVSQIQSTSLRLTWNPPGYTGNSRIVSYTVEMFREGGSAWINKKEHINPSSSQVSAVIIGLSPYTRYKFRVRAVNEVGTGLPSDETPYVRTFSAAPSGAPVDVKGQAATAQSFIVTWKPLPAATHNGQLLGYRIHYRQNGVSGQSGQSFSVKVISDGLATQGSVDGLLLWTEYEVKVQAFNNAGSGPFSTSVVVTTGEGVPTAPVQDLKILRITSTTVEMEWKPPPQRQWNGRLKGFKLLAWEPRDPSTIARTVVPHDSSVDVQRGTLVNLKKYTQYEVVVVAYNSAGDSPRSSQKLIRTEEGVPTAVSSFSVSDVYSDGFTVNWSPPSTINGRLTGYVIKHWRNDSQSVVITQLASNISVDITVTGLNPNSLYIVTVAAKTGAGLGPTKSLSVTTVDSPVLPGAPGKPQFLAINPWSVDLRWTLGFSGRTPILQYTIEYNNDSYFDSNIAVWRTVYVVQDAHRLSRLFPLTVPNLRPYTKYRFRVIATNKVGSSPPSPYSDSKRTLETAPSLPPSNLTVHKRPTKGEIKLTWVIPPEISWNSLHIGYNIKLTPSISSNRPITIQIPYARVTSYIVGGLLRYTTYTIVMTSYNLNGKGESTKTAVASWLTDQDAPEEPPSNVRAVVQDSTRILTSWGPIPAVGRNGEIVGYKIFYKEQGHAIEKVKQVGGLVYSAVIGGLESFVIYEFQVLGYTRHGEGPRSQVVRAKTNSSTPGAPARLRFPEVTHAYVKLTWDPPIYPRGNIIGYWVKYTRNYTAAPIISEDNNIRPTNREKIYSGLFSNVFYKFYVRARTVHGWGEEASAVVYTTDQRVAPDRPFIFPIPTNAIFQRSVTIEWRINEHRYNPIRYFTLQFDIDNGGWMTYPIIVAAGLRKLKVEGLLPGTRYRFRIMATNDVGNSQYSTPSQEITTIPTLPTGAPRDLRIVAPTSETLLVEWSAPLPDEVGGTITGYKLKYRKKGVSAYLQINLSASQRSYTIRGLDVFTTYYIKMATVNEKGEGVYTPDVPATTGEMAPKEPPSDISFGRITMTSVFMTWKPPPPESVRGLLRGYRIYFDTKNSRRRRRRSVNLGHCNFPSGPQEFDVGNDMTSANITNLRKYVTYGFRVVAYNSKGESPSTGTFYKTTLPDLPGPVHNFQAEAVYNERIDLRWRFPCAANGRIEFFEVSYARNDQSSKSRKIVSPPDTTVIISGLEMLTDYSVFIRVKNQVGYGPRSFVPVRTKGPAVLPGKPRKPIVKARRTSALLTWENGHSGNVPFIKYEIQARTGVEAFATRWNFKPEEITKNKTFVSCTVGNLEPFTSYQFRIIAWNQVGPSPPSEPSDVVSTGAPEGGMPKAIHEQNWFIALVSVFAVILVLVIIGFVFIQRRRKKERNIERLSSAASTSTRGTTDTSLRSSILPGVQITYRDPNEPADDVSSLSSKDGISDVESPESDDEKEELPSKDDKTDELFVGHYANDPSTCSWRNSLRRQVSHSMKEIDEIDEGMDITDGSGRPRFKSFTADEQGLPPPAYDSMTSNESLKIRSQLPPEAVTSFMSPEYEAKKSKSLSNIPAHSPYNSREDVGKPSGSRERINESRSPSRGSKENIGGQRTRKRSKRSPHGSAEKVGPSSGGSLDRLDKHEPGFNKHSGRAYGTLPTPQNRHHKGETRTPSFLNALGSKGNRRRFPRDSEESDRSSSGADYPDTRNLVRGHSTLPRNIRVGENPRDNIPRGQNPRDNIPRGQNPRPEYDPETGRRRKKPPKLDTSSARRARKSRDRPGSSSSGSAPNSPISPAPSYHSEDPLAFKMVPMRNPHYDTPRKEDYRIPQKQKHAQYPTGYEPEVPQYKQHGLYKSEIPEYHDEPDISQYKTGYPYDIPEHAEYAPDISQYKAGYPRDEYGVDYAPDISQYKAGYPRDEYGVDYAPDISQYKAGYPRDIQGYPVDYAPDISQYKAGYPHDIPEYPAEYAQEYTKGYHRDIAYDDQRYPDARVIENGFEDAEYMDNNEAQISSYQSFV